jgi:methylmalonyl-CoA mutase cobalamin-binding domain/chain
MVIHSFKPKENAEMTDFDSIVKSIVDLDSETVLASMREIMSDGGTEASRALEALQDGMNGVGDRFESGEYFLSDLLYAADLMTSAVEIIKPALSAGDGTRSGRIIIATVKGDLHDIGKNIVRNMLEAAGFEVIDLGIDVPAEKIAETAKNENIKIIALSGVLTFALESMKNVVEVFQNAGLRDEVRIIIGGNPVTEQGCKVVGADAWTRSPQVGVTICKEWASSIAHL